mgnify:CR=1 FL=1|jgi:hypothetical protein
MKGQVDKKRKVIINGKEMRLQSRRITLSIDPEVKAGKVKLNDIWYIFDLESGKVIYQGNNWTDCLNGVKSIIKEHL